MELQAKLEQLRKTVLDDAYVRREQRKETLQAEKAVYIKEMQDTVIGDTGRYIAAEERKLERQAKRDRSAWEFDKMRRLRRCRVEIEEQVIAELKERLIAFTKSAEYRPYLEKTLRAEELSVFSEGSVVLLGPDGADVQAVLAALRPDLRFEQDPSIELGGFRIRDERRQIMADRTLDKRVEEAGHAFLEETRLK